MISMKCIIALSAIAGLASAVIRYRNVRYSPCSPFLDSPEGQEYMRWVKKWSEEYDGKRMPESVRMRIMEEVIK